MYLESESRRPNAQNDHPQSHFGKLLMPSAVPYEMKTYFWRNVCLGCWTCAAVGLPPCYNVVAKPANRGNRRAFYPKSETYPYIHFEIRASSCGVNVFLENDIAGYRAEIEHHGKQEKYPGFSFRFFWLRFLNIKTSNKPILKNVSGIFEGCCCLVLWWFRLSWPLRAFLRKFVTYSPDCRVNATLCSHSAKRHGWEKRILLTSLVWRGRDSKYAPVPTHLTLPSHRYHCR